jgi:hypothetical protein
MRNLKSPLGIRYVMGTVTRARWQEGSGSSSLASSDHSGSGAWEHQAANPMRPRFWDMSYLKLHTSAWNEVNIQSSDKTRRQESNESTIFLKCQCCNHLPAVTLAEPAMRKVVSWLS